MAFFAVIASRSRTLLACAGMVTIGLLPTNVMAETGKADPISSDVLVGINYFAGWWKPLPNKWHRHDGTDWRKDFPDRVPLLGDFNTSDTMDREIVAAADHGVDYFLMLWYYNEPGKEREIHSSNLNNGLRQFVASRHSSRMKFLIEFCNHPPYEIKNQQQWEECIAEWVKYMKHPSCLRVGDRLVFKVHGAAYFLQQNGNDVNAARLKIDQLREAVRRAGLGEMLVGCGVGASDAITSASPFAQLFDFTATYMDVPPLAAVATDYPYEQLASHIKPSYDVHANDAIAYVPLVPAGWNPRPWGDPRPAFTLPARQEWNQALRNVKDALEKNQGLGFPLPDGSRQKSFTIYAWNEFGEGGIVAPTAGDKTMKLEEIKNVFGTMP